MKRILYLIGILHVSLCNCSGQTQTIRDTAYYEMKDFGSTPKADAHVHIRTDDTSFIHQAKLDNFRLLTIVVDEPPGMDRQERFAMHQKKLFPRDVSFATTFSVDRWSSSNWSRRTINHLQKSFAHGAVAVKIYKNIGMVLRDKAGHFVMIDNPRFDEVLDYLTDHQIPVIGHLGEPRDCWLPVNQMQMKANQKYYTRHPEYHMFLHPDHPSYEQQIAARDHMLEKHPQLHFVGAHLGSLEWNTDTLAMHLDKLPGMMVDMAARISDLEFLAMKDWQKVHDFFIRYQDRLVYGTDRIADDSRPSSEMAAFAHDAWLKDWAFFVTAGTLHTSSFDGEFRGLRLPKEVVDKIYRKNIAKLIGSLDGNAPSAN